MAGHHASRKDKAIELAAANARCKVMAEALREISRGVEAWKGKIGGLISLICAIEDTLGDPAVVKAIEGKVG